MKLASTSMAIMYNSIECGHPWRTPCIRVKGPERMSFILILDWMLVNAIFIISINLPQCPKVSRAEKKKFPIISMKGFDTSIMS